MRNFRAYVLIAAASGLVLSSAVARTETRCLEGRTAAGTCVDASLAHSMRQGVRVFTQPRLSYSGPAVAPSADRQYDMLRDWRQGFGREVFGACIPYCPD
jgi:hypothetical protein